MSSRQLAYVQKRRSTRIYNAVPLAVQGADAFRAPYVEQVSTLTINCHGCRYRSKYEVIQGDTVFLEVRETGAESTAYSCQAQVKWVQRLLTKEPVFEIAVELLDPGNIWGISTPPPDWFPLQAPKAREEHLSQQEIAPPEQALAARTTRPVVAIRNEESVGLASAEAELGAQLQREDMTGALSPSLGQLMAGFGKQIQIMVSQAASESFAQERERLVGEFRLQLRNEAARTLESEIAASKEEMSRQVLKEVKDAQVAAAQNTYEQWNQKIQQDMVNAAQCIRTQAVEASRRVEGMTVSTVERLQRNMEASRTDAIDRFLSRLREQLAPLLEDARVTLQNLAASENKLRDESQAIREQFGNVLQQAAQNSIAEVREKTLGMLDQFESDVAKRLVESRDGMQETSSEAIATTTRILRELTQRCEESAQSQLKSLVSSAADDVTNILRERTEQISRQFSNQLEANIRNCLERISGSIAEASKRTMAHSGD